MNELQSLQNGVDTIINTKVKQNNARQITGIVLNGVLRSITSFVTTALGLFYTRKEIDDKLTAIELMPGETGAQGEPGVDGKSAYQIWLDAGNAGSVATYLASLKGEKGETGVQGERGTDGYVGADGKSAFDVWLENGNVGSETDFLNSIIGAQGPAGNDGADGKSAYQVWLDAGNSGSVATFITSLKGVKGDTGATGAQGADGVLGSLTNLVTTATAFTLALASDTLLLGISKINATLNYLNDTKLTKTLTQNKLWIGNSSNVATESDILPEWTVGASQPGQKENKGLITEMIVADGSIIQIPTIIHKPITLTSTGTIQLLSDALTGSYYVIESIVLIGRGISVSQNPIISIGCNASTYNDIAASQTLSTLANGLNTLTLTANASKALVQANTNMFINITQALIGGGSFEIVIKGYLSKI